MNTTSRFTLITTLGFIAIASTTLTAHAQTYQWKDANGRTVISDTPPPGSAKQNSRSLGGATTQTENAPNAATPAAPKSVADKGLDFKKRQQELKEKTEKTEKEQAALAEKQESCRRARTALATLESGQRIATINEKGQREIVDDAKRQADIDRAKKVEAESCQ